METIAMIINMLGRMGMAYFNSIELDEEDKETLRKANKFVEIFSAPVDYKIIKDDD